jgi:CheY-like chemotaxis protein/anti-sigma regulatory factor (Ser/Thr protein kinase)
MALDELPDSQRQRLATIQSSGRALLATINDVLDVSKIETGRLELADAPFDLGVVADDLQALYGSLAQERGLELRFEIDPAVRGWRRGDAVRLRQVISNLIANALKFTEEGSVAVYFRGDAERLRVSVADTGIGIAPDQAPHLFESFVQGDGSSTRRFGGAGLGLAISKRVVGLMGGDIDFTSAEGEGSCFTFQAPLPAVESESENVDGAEEAPDLSRLRVLVVDDNAVNRTVVRTLLMSFGIQAEVAEDGAGAVEAWEAEAFDLILMDIHMPRMDGLEASRAIRAREAAAARARTPIIAVTASVLTHETAAYFAAGMDGCVPKPIELPRLLAAMQTALAGDDGEAERAVAV